MHLYIIILTIGKYLPKIGAHKAFSIGIFTTGTMCLLFGFLDNFQDPNYFIALSLLVRIVEAVGNAAFLTASFSLVAIYFQDSVATVFSLVEMSFGIGMILGINNIFLKINIKTIKIDFIFWIPIRKNPNLSDYES